MTACLPQVCVSVFMPHVCCFHPRNWHLYMINQISNIIRTTATTTTTRTQRTKKPTDNHHHFCRCHSWCLLLLTTCSSNSKTENNFIANGEQTLLSINCTSIYAMRCVECLNVPIVIIQKRWSINSKTPVCALREGKKARASKWQFAHN